MSRGEKSIKKVKIKTQYEKIIETNMDISHETCEKKLLESGRNSAMHIAAWFICNLLLKIENMPEI